MVIYKRGVIVAGIFCVLFWIGMRTHADPYLRVITWSFIITCSLFAVGRKLWHGREGTYSMRDVTPGWLRRWMLDEDKSLTPRL